MRYKPTTVASPMVLLTFLFMASLVCNVTYGQTKAVDQSDQAPLANSADSQTTDFETDKAVLTKQKIKLILTEQTKAWNDGDLNGFMKTYWNSPKLTFSSGGTTTHGWSKTLGNYKKNYPTPKEMGKLHFDGLEIQMIQSKSALVLGNWHLMMADESKRDGNFTLIVRQLDDGWKIIHDHSSIIDADDSDDSDEAEATDEKK